MNKIVAIDGFSSSGKSTMAKQLAKYASYTYVDTGAMYRAVGLYGLENGLITAENIDEIGVKEALPRIEISFGRVDGEQHTFLNGVDVESKIRTVQVADAASRVSTIGFVRADLVARQQKMGEKGGIVMDGRDIGTVVFPNADLKLFVTSKPEVRALRRHKELQAKGLTSTYEEILQAVMERDYRDTHRAQSPLKKADDAIEFDNSSYTIEEQFEYIKELFDKLTK